MATDIIEQILPHMEKIEISKRRDELLAFIETHDYQEAVEQVRDVLRQHFIAALGGDWEKMHNDHGLYTMKCRVKSSKRIMEKFDKLTKSGIEVTKQNFFKLMPDLVGGRLVTVDPNKLFKLASCVKAYANEPNLNEPGDNLKKKHLRVRHSKFSMYELDSFLTDGYTTEVEDSGYCSVHFVYKAGKDYFNRCDLGKLPAVRKLDTDGKIPITEWHIEIQVRTIMDEAWGEVDHFVRYEHHVLRDDPSMTSHFAALAGSLQAANHHVNLIQQLATTLNKQKTEE